MIDLKSKKFTLSTSKMQITMHNLRMYNEQTYVLNTLISSMSSDIKYSFRNVVRNTFLLSPPLCPTTVLSTNTVDNIAQCLDESASQA